MVKIETATASGTTPALYGIEIDENICQGYAATATPTAVLNVSAGAPVASGGVTWVPITLALAVTYQPCGQSSETRVKTFAEVVNLALPGTLTTITPTIGTLIVQPVAVCGNRARGVRVLTSMSVAYA